MSNLFEDQTFPACLESIYYDGRRDPGIIWKRPKEICDDPVFIEDGASAYDIAQGSLSDCWFLSAAAVLATRQELFNKIVPVTQNFKDDYSGRFTFHFWRYGLWEKVEIDDRLPTKDGKLYFCYNRNNPREFWCALLEKAYAKVHKCYQALANGFSQDALVDMTGGIGEFIDLNGSIAVKKAESEDVIPRNRNRLFKRLKKLMRKQCSFLCATIDVKDSTKYEMTLDTGLVTGHAYSICSVIEVHADADKAKLMKLRNPWGYREWNGAWSDGSSEWNNVPEKKRRKLGLVTDDEGEFWMSFDDFLANFDILNMCHLTPDSVQGSTSGSLWSHADYHGVWIKGATAGGCLLYPETYWMNPQYFVRLHDIDDDDDECTLVVSLMQKYARVKKTIEKKQDTEIAIGFDVFKYKGAEPEELDGFHAAESVLQIKGPMYDFEYLRERSRRYELPVGTYCIIPCTYEPNVEGEFLLRLAFEKPADSGEVDAPSGQIEHSVISSKFDELYEKHAGDDDVIDARELRRLLNDGIKKDGGEAFSQELCRVLIKSVTGDRRGTLPKPAVQEIWQLIQKYQRTFENFDKDGSGTLNIRELRRALKSTGVVMNKKTLAKVAMRYCGKSEELKIDEFILIATKINSTSEAFDKVRKGSGSQEKVEVTLDEILQMTL